MGGMPSMFRRQEVPMDGMELENDPAGARAAMNPYRYPPKAGGESRMTAHKPTPCVMKIQEIQALLSLCSLRIMIL